MDIDPSVTLRHGKDDNDYVIDPGAQLTALAILENYNQPWPYPHLVTALVSHKVDFEPGPSFVHHASFPSDWIDSSAFVLGDPGADFEPDPAFSGEMALMPGRSFNTVYNESKRPPDLSAGAGFATVTPSSEEMMSWDHSRSPSPLPLRSTNATWTSRKLLMTGLLTMATIRSASTPQLAL